jgi:hypothetical protein
MILNAGEYRLNLTGPSIQNISKEISVGQTRSLLNFDL